MARVASCPQCNNELLVPSEADGESWAKCPECRAFFQVKQATSREVLAAMIVPASEQQKVDLDARDLAPSTIAHLADFGPDDVETEIAEQQSTVTEASATREDDLELENLIGEPMQDELETAAAASDDVDTFVSQQQPIANEIAATQDDDLELDSLAGKPKEGDDLTAAAQRIDEWFRSAKTVPDTTAIGDVDSPEVEEIRDDLAPAGPSRTNATLDMDAHDADDFAAMADFDLDEPERPAQTTAAWDDAEQMDDLLADGDSPPSDEFAAEFSNRDEDNAFAPDSAHDRNSMSGDERPAINLFADNDSPEVASSKRRKPRRERSLVRSLVLITVAGLFGSTAGYFALLWLRGPSGDILNVAQYLPSVMLPGTFEQPKQIVRNAPPAISADTTADVEPTTTDDSTEPQEMAPAMEEAAEPMSDVAAATDAAPADTTDPTAEVQASYSEVDPAADAVEPASAVGDRYTKSASDTEAGSATDSTATGVTSEKPATTDISVDDLLSTESPSTEPSADPSATTEPGLPASTEPAAAGLTETEAPSSEPATLDAAAADPSFEIADANAGNESVEVAIADAPTFTSDDLRASLDAAAKAQQQLVRGNFADGKDVQRAKGAGFSMLADLAQKATFVGDDAKSDAAQLANDADELFRKTLADAHTRGDVAQILPLWMASKNRKHGGVFFGGKVVNHTGAGSVAECTVELDGGQKLTVLAPANAADQLDPAKPMAIVGWIVDNPTQVSGYTGGAKEPTIWAKKFISLE